MNKILQSIVIFNLILAVLWGSVGINMAHICHEHCYKVETLSFSHSESCCESACENSLVNDQRIVDPHPHHCECPDSSNGSLLKIDFQSLLAINCIFTMLPKELSVLIEASINKIPQTYLSENTAKDPTFKGRDILILKSVLII